MRQLLGLQCCISHRRYTRYIDNFRNDKVCETVFSTEPLPELKVFSNCPLLCITPAGNNYIATGDKNKLSEQEMLTCSYTSRDGCRGGWMSEGSHKRKHKLCPNIWANVNHRKPLERCLNLFFHGLLKM